ncbi:MAG: InlB B-repeat-containing protein [Gaiellaceae bacterium]
MAARIALGASVVLAVLLIGGALPAFSSPTAPGRHVVPLRVRDAAAFGQAKVAAEHAYELWRQRRGLAPLTLAPTPWTAVSGNLNQPGITDAATTGTPSDSTGAIGPSNYVEFINSEIGVYSNTDLSTPTELLDESVFVGSSDFTCDPQIQWDEEGQRWLYAALDCGAAAGSQALYFGWSKTPSPGPLDSNWCQYTVPTTHSIEDYPKLGHDGDQIIIGTNAFDDRGSEPYLESHIWVFDKPGSGDASCPASGTELGDSLEAVANSGNDFTPVPADIADSSVAGYVVAETDLSHLDLYTIGHDGGGNNAVLGRTPVTVATFDFPANVPQPGTSDVVDSSDTRLTQAVAVTDPATGQEGVWTQHTVAGPGGGPSVVRWYELTPGASAPRQTGTVSGPSGSFAFNGAISPTKDGTSAAIFYNSGSSSRLVDLRVQDRRPDTALGTSVEDLQLASSAAADEDFSCPSGPLDPPCRWGDYAAASPDPSNACLVWGTSMLTADAPDGFGTPQWGTQNAAINVCGFTLSLAKSGTGSGTVSSNDGGISCGAACSHSYGIGTSVTLTATPAAGSAFSGWSGACSGTGTCTVGMTQAQAVTATFSLLPETLTVTTSGSGTVTSSPAGVSCGAACSHAFDYGTSVTLTSTPASGSVFQGWSGACSGAGTCSVTMSGAQSVHATFARKIVCVVPKVKGKKLKAAKAALARAHCRPGTITRKYSKVGKGRVISQKPRPGRHLARGAKVNLAVSKGKKP